MRMSPGKRLLIYFGLAASEQDRRETKWTGAIGVAGFVLIWAEAVSRHWGWFIAFPAALTGLGVVSVLVKWRRVRSAKDAA